MATLYRKYRPQKFSEIFGQNHIKMTLEHELATGKIAHAYLFCGPRAIGKTTIARIFAKSVNCLNRKPGEHEPCNICSSCQDIVANRSLDIIEIDAASHTGVDNVRENIIASVRVSPSQSKFKVFIIDEVHMLSTSAFNALLKSIEEPPAYVIFILCTTEIHKVPSTIISRCQRFDFKRIGISDIVKKLQYIVMQEGVTIDKKILAAIARYSEGHMRDAESLLGQVVAVGGKEITEEEANLVIPRSDLNEALHLIDALNKKDAATGISLINKLLDEGVDLKSFLDDLIELLRKIMLTIINPTLAEKLNLELGDDIEKQISDLTRSLNINQVIAYLEKIQFAKNEMKNSFIVQLPIEIAIAELCSGTSRPTPVSLNTPWQPTQLVSRNITGAPTNQTTTPAKPNAPLTKIGNFNLNKEAVLERWNEVLARVKKYNHSLSFILRVCQPREVNNSELQLAFKYKFHKDRIGENSIKAIVEKVLQEVYGQQIFVSALIDETIEANNDSSAFATDSPVINEEISDNAEKQEENKGGEVNMIDNLLKTFGGKIVK